MAKNSVADLLSVDSLFTTQAERDEARRETVRDIPLVEISDFPNHPFKVRMDQAMEEMADSVRQYGVLVPALVRPKPEGGYELVAGHRRKKASELAGKETLSCIVRELTDDEAILTNENIFQSFSSASNLAISTGIGVLIEGKRIVKELNLFTNEPIYFCLVFLFCTYK